MGFNVICISRTAAAGGEHVGHAVAERLGFRYVDEEIIERAAKQADLVPAMVAAAERRQPLLKRLLEKIAIGSPMVRPAGRVGGHVDYGSVPAAAADSAGSNDLRLMIRAAIHEVAAAGRAVIVAHAASMALGDTAGALRVLITASAGTRVRRIAEFERIVEPEAERRISASDRDRQEYFRRFYEIDAELPTHYDLVINTDSLSVDDAVDLIAAAAQAPAIPMR